MSDFSYEILDVLKKYNGDEQAALAGETSPQCLYALSPLRENLLEWVELSGEARVLQIGSDYGSVTGLLADKAAEVVVLDARDENLEVNRLRHVGKGNLRFFRGDVMKPEDGFKEYRPDSQTKEADPFARSFDCVVLIGAFAQYKKEEATSLLEKAGHYLKPGGKLLAAAENEFGVRYFMGAKPLDGSFLETEFRQLFKELVRVQGGSFTMYYPVPDYRYPVAVYSDTYLPETGDVTNISARLDGEGFWFGSEEETMAKACQNGTFTKFANSFLGVWEKGNI